MKRLVCILVALTLSLSIFACAGAPAPPDGGSGNTELPDDGIVDEKDGYTQVLSDPQFKKGFNLMGLNSATDGTTVYKRITYGSALGNPQWQMAQWWSKFNLKDGNEVSTTTAYSLTDQSKAVKVDIPRNALTLEVNASKEFDTYNTNAPAAWPHLLIEQSIKFENFYLKNASEVVANLEFTLTKEQDNRAAPPGMGLHAQFAWFIYIVDKNPQSAGYGNFLWFGLNIYNSTTDYAGDYSSQDTAGGLGNFIYSVGAKNFLSKPIKIDEKVTVAYDILPKVTEGLAVAQSRGFMPNSTINDCAITGMNIGWEVFDRFDVAIEIEKLGIGYKKVS